jgi:hypothetical protein
MPTCAVLGAAAHPGSEYLRPRGYGTKTCEHDLGLQVIFRPLSKAFGQPFKQQPEAVFAYKNVQVPLNLPSSSGATRLCSAALWLGRDELSGSYTPSGYGAGRCQLKS